MSAAERRSEALAELRRYAQAAPKGFAAGIIAAGPRAVRRHIDRVVLWDALATLRNIDLRAWRSNPNVGAAIREARAAVLRADSAMARAVRRERAS